MICLGVFYAFLYVLFHTLSFFSFYNYISSLSKLELLVTYSKLYLQHKRKEFYDHLHEEEQRKKRSARCPL